MANIHKATFNDVEKREIWTCVSSDFIFFPPFNCFENKFFVSLKLFMALELKKMRARSAPGNEAAVDANYEWRRILRRNFCTQYMCCVQLYNIY